MELFILALLAAAAAADQGESALDAAQKKLPPLLPHPADDENAYQQHAIQFWTFMGEAIMPWNNLQDTAWLLDTFVCPEGHCDHVEVYTDGGFYAYPVMRKGEQSVVDYSPENRTHYELAKVVQDQHGEWDNFEAMPPTGYCSHPAHQGPRLFTIPHRVVDKVFNFTR